MKKLIFTLAIVLGVATVSAQEVGQMWVGGSVGFSSSKTKLFGESVTTTSFTIMPEFGYVLQDNLGIGINLGYIHTKEGDAKSDAFKVAPFVRYSFLKGNIGGLFVDGGVAYIHSKVSTEVEDEYYERIDVVDVKTDTYEVGFRPGVAINVSSKVALTAKFGFLGYQHIKMGKEKTDKFKLDLDLSSALFGVNFVF